MPLGKLMFLAMFSQFALPPQATVLMDGPFHGSRASDELFCVKFHLRAANVRWRLDTYREITAADEHDWYLVSTCGLKGRIVFNGKVFTWKVMPYNRLDTDWPDGKWKMLGGKHSDDPSQWPQ